MRTRPSSPMRSAATTGRPGRGVFLLTGTDEFGQKIQEEAARRGVEPQALCDRMAGPASRTRGGRWTSATTASSGRRRPATSASCRRSSTACTGAATSTTTSTAGGTASMRSGTGPRRTWGPGATCPDCGRPVRRIEEKNYFFRMSRLQEALLAHIDSNPAWIVPEIRRNEVLGFLEKPLADLSISRPPLPASAGACRSPFDPEHVTYVWGRRARELPDRLGRDRSRPATGRGGVRRRLRLVVALRPPHRREGTS